MNFFKEIALRLKQELSLSQDKEIADMLGLSPRAWAGRKERGVFPEKELYALTAKRPDLNIDVSYVLTGQHIPAPERAAFDRADKFTRILEPDGSGPLTQTSQGARVNHGKALQERTDALAKNFFGVSEDDRQLVEAVMKRCLRAAG